MLGGHPKHKMMHKGHYAIAAALSSIAISLRPAGAEVHATSGESKAGRFQLVSHGESVSIIDTTTGKTWQKCHKSDQGSTVWNESEPS